MKKLLLGAFVIFVVVSNISAQEDQDWRPLYKLVDTSLQAKLDEEFRSIPQLRKLIAQKKLAIGVVDMNGDMPRFARINGNKMMYAASLPKIAILLAAYQSFEDGSLEETEEIHSDLVNMIRTSDNHAATKIIDKVGFYMPV